MTVPQVGMEDDEIPYTVSQRMLDMFSVATGQWPHIPPNNEFCSLPRGKVLRKLFHHHKSGGETICQNFWYN